MPDTIDEGALGWLRKTALRSFWRVQGYYELDDLIQDGFFLYYMIRKKYPHATTPQHIMRLFQVSYINHIHDLSKQTTQYKTMQLVDGGDVLYFEGLIKCHEPAVSLELAAGLAPPPIDKALTYMLTDEGARQLRQPYNRRPDGTRETTNERLCRLIGIDPAGFDLPRMIRMYLSSDGLGMA